MADEVEVVGRELETVFEARDESEAWAVQGMLQSAGIEALVQSLEFPQEIMPGVGSVAVRVPVQQAGRHDRSWCRCRTIPLRSGSSAILQRRCHHRRSGICKEPEGDCAERVRAKGADMRVLETLEHFATGVTETVVLADGDHREPRMHGVQERRRG